MSDDQPHPVTGDASPFLPEVDILPPDQYRPAPSIFELFLPTQSCAHRLKIDSRLCRLRCPCLITDTGAPAPSSSHGFVYWDRGFVPRTVTYCRAFLTVTLFGNGPVSTLVMVEKGGEGCMAADTLMSYGMRKQPARYVARPEKIIGVDGWYIGLFGRCAHQAVLESAFAHGLKLPETASEQDLFEFSRVLHRKLKKEGFLNPTENADDPYESSQMMSFLLTRNGMFGLYPLGSVERHRRFAAAGSGTDYALRAMYPAYRQDLAAEETARLCVEAGIEFDHASLGPITLMRIQLEREGVPARECESVAATA